jgi:hypothetical protein
LKNEKDNDETKILKNKLEKVENEIKIYKILLDEYKKLILTKEDNENIKIQLDIFIELFNKARDDEEKGNTNNQQGIEEYDEYIKLLTNVYIKEWEGQEVYKYEQELEEYIQEKLENNNRSNNDDEDEADGEAEDEGAAAEKKRKEALIQVILAATKAKKKTKRKKTKPTNPYAKTKRKKTKPTNPYAKTKRKKTKPTNPYATTKLMQKLKDKKALARERRTKRGI